MPTEQEIMNIAFSGISEERRALLEEIVSEIVENINNYNKQY
jgi:hypothetical protein